MRRLGFQLHHWQPFAGSVLAATVYSCTTCNHSLAEFLQQQFTVAESSVRLSWPTQTETALSAAVENKTYADFICCYSGSQQRSPLVRPSIHPFVLMFVRPSVRSSTCPSVHLAYLSIRFKVRPPVRPSVRPSTRPSVRPPTRLASVRIKVRPSFRQSVNPPVRPPDRPSLHPPCPSARPSVTLSA